VRGRKAKPTAMKELEGNPGKRALNHNEPKPEVVIPDCPAHLIGPARTEWKRVTKELVKLKIISVIDQAALSGYCLAYADVIKATNKIKKQGEVIISEKGGLYQNPWVSIRNSAIDRMVKIAAEFGMTPSSRSRVKVEAPDEEGKMEQFLFGNANVKVKTKQ
jgi:P27 family predicted phage terminase small subunit